MFFRKILCYQRRKAFTWKGYSLRYSVLQLGPNVVVDRGDDYQGSVVRFPGEILAVATKKEFPKFNVPPVILSYDITKPPSRKIFTNIPLPFREETERRLQDLLDTGIIELVTDSTDRSFFSSLLVVPKGKDDIRLVVDLRGPNKCIISTPFRMPHLEEILADLHGAKYFSTIDLTSAFFHVEIAKQSRHLANFFCRKCYLPVQTSTIWFVQRP